MLTDAASVHRRYELGRPDAAFLPICVINDADDKWRKRLCVGIRVKVWIFILVALRAAEFCQFRSFGFCKVVEKHL